jgi:hypothetical protein
VDILIVIALGPLGAASVLVLICCSLSAYIPEFALMGISLILRGGGLARGAGSTSIAFRSLGADSCWFVLKAGSFLRGLPAELAEGPDGGNRVVLRRSEWLVSRDGAI